MFTWFWWFWRDDECLNQDFFKQVFRPVHRACGPRAVCVFRGAGKLAPFLSSLPIHRGGRMKFDQDPYR